MIDKQTNLNAKLEKKRKKQELKNQIYYEKYSITIDEVREVMAKRQMKENSPENSEKIDKNQKNTKNSTDTKFFLSIYLRRKGYICAIVLLTLLSVVTSVFCVPVLQAVVDFVVAENYMAAMYAALILGGVTVLNYLLALVTNLIFTKFNSLAIKDMRNMLAERVLNTQSKSYRTLTTGEIVQRVSNDPRDFVNNTGDVWWRFGEILRSVGIVAYFYVINVWLGVILTVICVIDFLLRKLQLKFRRPKMVRASILSDKQNSQITEFVRGSDDVKSLNIKSAVMSVFSKWTEARYHNHLDSSNYGNTTNTAINIFRELLLTGYVVLAVWFIVQDVLSISVFAVIIRYIGTPATLGNFLNQIMTNCQNAGINIRRMSQVFDTSKYAQESFGDKELADFKGNVEIKNLTLKYDDEIVLKNINFSVPANQTLAIVGKSGEGKSTILSLINRLIDADKGKILLDGVDNKILTEKSLRSNMSLVPQAPYIFNATIRENLLYAKSDATEDEIVAALKNAQFYDFVMSKPQGLDTLVGEGGVILSGGQRQRLAIARAFLTDCKVLMLDEATSALDNENQEGIKNVINSLKSKCTFIIVAHRLSTIVDCDNILVLNNHEIVASGSHDELIKNCDIYKDLYALEDKNKSA